MIIIESENGKVFVNDKNVEVVQHSKDKAMVEISTGNLHTVGTVKSVVGVRYISDNHDADIREDSNELEALQKRYDELAKWANDVRSACFEYEGRIDELESQLNKQNKVYIVTEDCDNDETRNVACFSTDSAARKYCEHYNEGLLKPRYLFEEWNIGESYSDGK